MDVCEACGERNPAGSAFCVYCGVYLGWDQREGEEQSNSAPTAAPTAAPAGTGQSPAGAGPYSAGAGQAPPTYPSAPQGNQAGSYQAQPAGQSYDPAGVSPHDVTAPQPTVPLPGVQPIPPGEAPCPSCGNPNPTTRRFCGKCGHPLRPGTGTAGVYRRQEQQKRSWWQRFRDPVDRKARRDYRHSLPPLYRYRRVLIVLVALLAITGLLYALGRNPVGWVKDKYYAVRGTFVAVRTIGYQPDPPTSVVRGYSAAALGTPEPDDAWATSWAPQGRTPTPGCDGRLAAPGKVRVNFAEPTRVRRLEIVAGLPEANQNRPFVYRPKRVYVMYEGGCNTIDLRDTADVQKVDVDTTTAVGAITIAIGDAYPARADAPRPQVAMTALTALARPK